MEKHAILGFGPNDSDTIRKWLIGGASAGAGLGLLTSFINYLKKLKSLMRLIVITITHSNILAV